MEEGPRVGEECSVAFPNALIDRDTALWTLFMPALSFFNGWPDHLDDLDQSCLVHCLALGLPENGWQAMRVLDLIRIRALELCFQEDRSGSIPDIPKALRKRFDWQDLTLFDANLQGDIGCWLICRSAANGRTALVYAEWGSGGWDSIYAGNRPLSSDEHRVLAEVA